MFYFPLVVSPYCINIYTLHYFLQSRYEIQTYRRIRGHRGSRSLNHGWLPHHPAFISTVTADSFKAVDLMSVVHFWVSEQRDTVLLWKGNREERPSLSDSHVKTRKQHGIPNFQTLTHAVCPHKEATGLTQHFVCKYSAVFFLFMAKPVWIYQQFAVRKSATLNRHMNKMMLLYLCLYWTRSSLSLLQSLVWGMFYILYDDSYSYSVCLNLVLV